jgi:hypothetical protein
MGGSGARLAIVVTVVAPPAAQALTVRRTWRTTRRCATRTGATRRCFTTFAWCTRGLGCCVTCIAPPPMIAPPHAQAQSFAKAILTDMTSYPVFEAHRWNYHLRSNEMTVQSLANGSSRIHAHFLGFGCLAAIRSMPFRLMFHLGAVSRPSQ